MTLSSGTRLGPYQILDPLGAGGMGEVYRARDTRLGREVAVKVLPSELSADRTRLSRFEKEARSASSLNHPNIVTIHEIGQSDSRFFIVMELIEGATLREVLAEGPLPVRRLLQIATQVADGLAKAHAAGIVHRDLKPENVMVTPDGFVKILDFGLAKLTQPELESGQLTHAPTISAGTEPGVVMGTVGYMSPEQASGKPVDFRSDQFSFGSVLYEMATGKRAFHGNTGPETLAAIIREDPEPIASLNPKAPAPLRWIVERCLAKEPKERYASTEDLARDLATVRDHLSEASVAGETVALPVSRIRARIRLSAALFAVLAGLGAGYLAGKRARTSPPPSFHQLTYRRGTILSARFAPDGETVVYSAAWDGQPLQLFLKRPESPDAIPIALPSANILAVSPSGEMAIALDCRYTHAGVCSGTLARAAMTGGAPREIAEGVQQADWTSDGANLLVVRDVAGRGRLEFPLGKVLYETAGHISFPRLSPKGDWIAFLDHPLPADDRGTVAVVDLAGKKRTLSGEFESVEGIAWSPSGREIWFTAATSGLSRALYAVTLSGRQRVVARIPGGVKIHDMARSGRVLLARDTWRIGILGLPPGESKERDLSWLDGSFASDLSADGKTLLFEEQSEAAGPNYVVCLRKTDGSPAVRLGEGGAQALSPDGKWALSRLPSPDAPLVLLPTGSGERKLLKSEGVRIGYGAALWFPDGKRILVAGSEPGHGVRLYVQDLEGGKPRPITPEGVIANRIIGRFVSLSPDGKFVAAIGPDPKGALYPVDGGGPRPIPGLEAGEFPLRWSADGRWLYVRKPDELPARVFLIEVDTGRRMLWKELMPGDSAGVGRIYTILLTPDGKSYAYDYERSLSDLYLAEGLK